MEDPSRNERPPGTYRALSQVLRISNNQAILRLMLVIHTKDILSSSWTYLVNTCVGSHKHPGTDQYNIV